MKDEIVKALQKATGLKNVDLEFPENEEFGDYSSNIAMTMFSNLQISNLKYQIRNTKYENPRELAETIVEKLKKDKELARIVDKIEVAGPGFINFWLSKEALVGELERSLEEKDTYGTSKTGIGKTAVFDYSSPNIAKRFSIGHLRSTVIGQALYNLYKFLGYKVIGDNHLGDWGTQFGSLLAEIKNLKLKIKNLNIDKLEELYVDFNKEVQENPELWDEARGWFKKLEEGDKEARKIWQEIVNISMAEFERIYKILGVKIDYAYGESFYEDKMPEVIKLLREKNISKKSQGAEIVEFANLPPAMLVKSDGTTTYFTRDLATVKFRIKEWDPQIIIYEVGSDQTLHFRQLFETVNLLGWAKDREFVHIAHGLIRFEHGKMSTRRGQTIKLEEVLNEAIERAKKIIEKSETSRGLSGEEKEDVAEAVGIGAIKYFDLSHHPISDIIFDWKKMFVMEGNSAPYLQYTVARTNSVLAKLKTQNLKLKTINHLTIQQFNHEEELVLRSLSRFSEIIVDAAKNYSPNLLANYLFDLAQKFNNFYNLHRILPPEKENGKWKMENGNFRLALTVGVGQVLKNGLRLLDIESPQRM